MVVWKYSTISQHLYQTAGNIYCVLHLVISPPAPFYPLLDAETWRDQTRGKFLSHKGPGLDSTGTILFQSWSHITHWNLHSCSQLIMTSLLKYVVNVNKAVLSPLSPWFFSPVIGRCPLMNQASGAGLDMVWHGWDGSVSHLLQHPLSLVVQGDKGVNAFTHAPCT